VGAWAEKDPEAVWQWFQRGKEKGDSQGGMASSVVLSSLFGALGNSNPELAFKRMSELDGSEKTMAHVRSLSSEEQRVMRSEHSGVLMMNDPKRGAAFILEGATDDEKPDRYRQVVQSWAYQDANAAGNWLKEQPEGPQLDKAKEAFVSAASLKDPGSAMVWATTISDKQRREGTISQVYDVWMQKEPDLALEALKASGAGTALVERLTAGPAVKP
jgi:hypothetical protein